MAGDVSPGELAAALSELADTINNLLQYGQDIVKESIDDFVNSKIGKLFGMAVAYQKCFNRIGVGTKDEMEAKISTNARHSIVREAGESLLDCEEEISAAGGHVVIISFGLQDGADLWLQDTKAPFQMLLDTERKIYHAFGLYRSVIKVWGVASLVFYAEAMAAGRPLPKPYENVHDDTIQMGGDFILDSQGIVRFLYPSQTNTDRPSVSLIIEELKKIQGSSQL